MKYKNNQRQDPSYNKTVLRNALKKCDYIEEMKHLHIREGDSPYKVYRFRNAGKILLANYLS